ncbi:hypothetical protein HELRODRAFT_186399 [Helobdella robusta]|uniref:Ammonium transporter AmtB-like domain-containing protein n=1 Tax=Helobdella robusta TaxID=6412 RepID=T1FNZ1_HELRO|nr:hypothetical protein HELRODRAFT_186399 [Helobdella robusta]ESO06642.1 hypothetical protein HELRODRAFT_186399 [Helobdella robusta]
MVRNYCKFPNKFTLAVIICEIIILVFFGVFVRYDWEVGMPKPLNKNYTEVHAKETAEEHVEHYYSLFQDIHIMMFIGFGFLMTFLKRYGFSSVGMNFFIAAFVLQWQTIIHGWIDTFEYYETLIESDFAAAAVLISFGAVLGKVSPIQLLIMAAMEIVFYEGNIKIVIGYIGATDIGDSMTVHTFGAYFGLMVAWVLYKKEVHDAEEKEGSVYQSDIFAMIGTIFLWICWPSFNSGTAVDEGRVRAIVNTYYSLTASVITTFAISSLVDKKNRFNMVHVQNSTLAGGVAIGSVADMIIQPWAAILTGMVAGVVSVLGYKFLTPYLSTRLKLHDTCGVHNLHGMPGVISGLGSILAAGISYPYLYENGLTKIFGDEAMDTSLNYRAGMQAACLGVTLGIAMFGGLMTGAVLKIPIFDHPIGEQIFDDEDYWIIPVDESHHRPAVDGEEMGPTFSKI